MYYLQCQCRFTNQWDDMPDIAPFSNLTLAIWHARVLSQQKRTAVRVVDDQGNVWS